MTKPLVEDASLRASLLRKADESARVKREFFAAEADRIVACARALSGAFAAGGKLFAFGNGGSACDAEHVAVELMHPVVQKRAPLPAFALSTQPALLSAIANDEDHALAFARQLRVLGRAGDIALGISTSGQSASVNRGLAAARELGLLTIGFSGRDGGKTREQCDYAFVVDSFVVHRIQETHETLLHVLWDLVHLARGEEDVL